MMNARPNPCIDGSNDVASEFHDGEAASDDMKIERGGGSMSRALNGIVHAIQHDASGPLEAENHKAPQQPPVVDSQSHDEANQQELDMILDFLRLRSSKLQEELDEDAIGGRIVRTDQLGKRRVLFEPDLEADSEEEENRIVHGVAYREEADLLVRQELYKQVASFAKASNCHSKKTMSWLKKRIGLQKKKESRLRVNGTLSREAGCESDDMNDYDKSQSSERRRLTRGMARHTRVKKREERLSSSDTAALQSLLAAAEEFDVDEQLMLDDQLKTQEDSRRSAKCIRHIVDTTIKALMSKPAPPIVNHSHKEFYLAIARDTSLDLSGFVRASQWMCESESTDIDVDEELEIKVASIIVGGNNVEPIMRFLFKDDEQYRHRRSWTGGKRKRPRVQPASEMTALPGSKKGNRRKRKMKHSDGFHGADGSAGSFADIDSWGVDRSMSHYETLHPISVITRHPLIMDPTATGRPTGIDGRYSAWTSKLMRRVNTDGRPFTRYEYFYSDVDRPWFNYDWLSADLADRGIPPHSNFERANWKAIRREVLPRPRRFSKRFIQQELRKLEEYRSTVRILQHTDLQPPEGFPFEVIQPIKVGDHVTAFNDQLGALRDAVVVGYDFGRCAYLVSFDQMPSTFCPDTFVASHGEPQLLHDAEPITVNDSAAETVNFRLEGGVDSGSRKSNGVDHDDVVNGLNRFSTEFLTRGDEQAPSANGLSSVS